MKRVPYNNSSGENCRNVHSELRAHEFVTDIDNQPYLFQPARHTMVASHGESRDDVSSIMIVMTLPPPPDREEVGNGLVAFYTPDEAESFAQSLSELAGRVRKHIAATASAALAKAGGAK